MAYQAEYIWLDGTEPTLPAAMKALVSSDSDKYRRATEEALALLRWIRQLAGLPGGGHGQQ